MDREMLDLERRVRELERVESSTIAAWVPAWGASGGNGSYTYDTNNTWGRYQQTGNAVLFWGRIRISAISVAPTGNMRIGPLPVVCNSVAYGFVAISWLSNLNTTAGITQVGAFVQPGEQNIYFTENTDNAASALYPAANFTNTAADIIFGGSYLI